MKMRITAPNQREKNNNKINEAGKTQAKPTGLADREHHKPCRP
jgi:hypothetical protein